MARASLRGLARLARRTPAPLLRAAGLDRSLGRPFAVFERDDGSRIELLDAYRDSVKPSWRVYWWPTRLLFALRGRVGLPPEFEELVHDIERSRTLPAPPEELAQAVQPLLDWFPEDVRWTAGAYTEAGIPALELRPDPVEAAARAAAYRAQAEAVRREVILQGINFENARILDAGTGSGYLAFALAGLGADVVGVDLDPETYVWRSEREAMREFLAPSERVVLERGDVHDLQYEDSSFDAVCSLTAVEHFADVRRALRELTRILKPGGLGYHVVEPWFGKCGGHSLCTLDYPWGHVRLTPDELDRYFAELRPHEASNAIDDARGSFQRPPLTLSALRTAFEEAGMDILSWDPVEVPVRDPHRAVLSAALLRECWRFDGTVTRADLLTLTVAVVGRRQRRPASPRAGETLRRYSPPDLA